MNSSRRGGKTAPSIATGGCGGPTFNRKPQMYVSQTLAAARHTHLETVSLERIVQMVPYVLFSRERLTSPHAPRPPQTGGLNVAKSPFKRSVRPTRSAFRPRLTLASPLVPPLQRHPPPSHPTTPTPSHPTTHPPDPSSSYQRPCLRVVKMPMELK